MKALLGAFALSLTAVRGTPILSRQDDLIGLWNFSSCNATQKSDVITAFADARQLATDAVLKRIDWNHPAALEYFGPPQYSGPYQDRIADNFVRAMADHTKIGDWWYDRYIEIHCNDILPTNGCTFKRRDGSIARAAAYTLQTNEKQGRKYPAFVFCPGWFDELKPLSEIIAMGHAGTKDWHNTTDMRNRAVTFLHEMMHISKVSGETRYIGDPTIVDNEIDVRGKNRTVYKAALAKYLAKTGADGAEIASRNNDNYAYYALARYLEYEFGEYPEKPPAFDPAKDPFIGDDPVDQPNDVDNRDANYNNVYSPGPTNPDSLYPDDYIKKYGSGASSPQPSQPPKPVPEPNCGGSPLNANFPPGFVLTDGQEHSIKDILYRMRDQACQSKCESIDGVPGQLSAAKVQNTNGCEFAAKIATDKELYFYASGSGQNCYDATAKIIDQCVDSQKKDAGWINGPNDYEFYQAGVRAVNGDGNHHDPITDSGFLGHRHVACNRPGSNPFADNYQVYISQWDDGDWGKSIQRSMGGCHLSVTGWKYEDYDGYTFADGSKSQKIAKFNTVLSNGGCIESKIEAAMGLGGGGLNCPYNRAEELNEF